MHERKADEVARNVYFDGLDLANQEGLGILEVSRGLEVGREMGF